MNMDMFEEEFNTIIDDIIQAVFDLFEIEITHDDIVFDDSRSWSLYIPGAVIGLPVRKFGAYRNYLGGGLRGPIEHNGNDMYGTFELGELFASCLREIEDLYNQGYDDSDDWDKPTGVLL